MRLFHLELEREPALAIELHPRLTVLAVEPTLRARLVDALDGLLRGRASELRGALGAEGMRAEFMVESPSGPVLPGVPTIVREGDIDVSADANAPSATERAEARHAEALQGLDAAEAALAQQQVVVERLHARGTNAVATTTIAPPAPAPLSAESDACRKELRVYLDELQSALLLPSRPERLRVDLLERGTVLAADASRLGVCRPATVRALLDAIDALNVVPAAPATPVDTLVRQVATEVDGRSIAADPWQPAANDPLGGDAELSDAERRLAALERELGAARSRALAVFAELESVRRTAGSNGRARGGAFSSALRARLNRPMPTTWVGASPIVLDDALAACPADDVDAARAAVLDAAQRAQVVYLTNDADTLTWASRLPTDLGTVTRVPPS
jgi:hypothetical protein